MRVCLISIKLKLFSVVEESFYCTLVLNDIHSFVVILSPFQDSKNKKKPDMWFKQPIEAHLIVSQYYCCIVEPKGQQDFNCTNKAERS